MNETRDLIMGIDFGKKYSQICYYDRKAEEARSLPVKEAVSMKLPPVCAGGRTQIRKNTVLAWKRNILPEKKADFCWRIFMQCP